MDSSALFDSGTDESHGALPGNLLCTSLMVLEVAYQSELVLDIVKMDDELHVVGVAVVLIVVAEAAAEHLVENEDQV